MIRPLALVLTVACATLLTGCLPPETPPVADPAVSPAAPTPTETLETPVTLPALVLPECADLYSADEILALMGEHMEFIVPDAAPENRAYGTGFPELRAELDAGDSITCSWGLPGSEYVVTVSVMLAPPAVFDLVAATLRAAGSEGTSTGGDSIIFSIDIEETQESRGQTEAHYLSPEIWVSAQGTQSAPALTQAAMDYVIELNPAYSG